VHGAVLFTLNIRLAGEQIAFIANQAEDCVVLVDMSLAPMLEAVLPEMTSVHTVVAVGEGDAAPLTTSGKTVIRYDDLLDGQPIEFDRPDLDERSAAAMCYTSGTTGNPKDHRRQVRQATDSVLTPTASRTSSRAGTKAPRPVNLRCCADASAPAWTPILRQNS
jgi:acyl-coenzyme A synthetase/AMP-(fatty) acid ligase